MTIENIIEVKKVTKVFPGIIALDEVDFELRKGEVHAIVGENGAGKSTLVKTITGVLKQTSGSIYYEGKEINWQSPINAQLAGISAIYQEPTLYPDLNVLENIFMLNQKLNKITRKINWKYNYNENNR